MKRAEMRADRIEAGLKRTFEVSDLDQKHMAVWSNWSRYDSKGKGTGQRVLSTHYVGHYQLAAHYKYQA